MVVCFSKSVLELRKGRTKTDFCCSNCTSIQWWNGSYCREKGIPAWGSNTSSLCNATYQCADYNLVSCPFGGSTLFAGLATCECATTKYWVRRQKLLAYDFDVTMNFQNGITCIDRVLLNQPCTLWLHWPVNTSTCLNAAGAGLLCSRTACNGNGVCTGTCYCPIGTNWNTTFSICTPPQRPG